MRPHHVPVSLIGVLVLAVVALGVTAIAGCGEPPAPLPVSTIPDSSGIASDLTAATSPPLPADVTFETVILGPGDRPISKADIAPALFHDEPAVGEALKTSFASSQAALGGPVGDHLILVLKTEGAAASATGADVYVNVFEQWYVLVGWKPVRGSGSAYPARIRLTKDGDSYRVDGADWPQDGDGYRDSLNQIFPRWVRGRLMESTVSERLQEASWTAAIAWAQSHVPADLFVDQMPATISDPHKHKPASSHYRMLSADYVDCTVASRAVPTSEDYQAEHAYSSKDGRFRLFFLLTGHDVAV